MSRRRRPSLDSRARPVEVSSPTDPTATDLPTFVFGERPQLVFTWGADFPDRVKVRKVVSVWPLAFKLRLDYTSATRSLSFGCSCKETLLGGRLRLDVPAQQLEYRKRVCTGGSTLALTARCSYAGLLTGQALQRPSLGIAVELGAGTARWAGNVFDLRQRLRLTKVLGLEVCSSAQLPVPRAQFTLDGQQQAVELGTGPTHLHVAQLNVSLDL